MADSNRPRGECQHGQLARQCELCEKDATIAEQAATIARLEGERDALRARVQSVRAAVDEAMARADVTKEQAIAAVIKAVVPLSSVTAEDIAWASGILKEQP